MLFQDQFQMHFQGILKSLFLENYFPLANHIFHNNIKEIVLQNRFCQFYVNLNMKSGY